MCEERRPTKNFIGSQMGFEPTPSIHKLSDARYKAWQKKILYPIHTTRNGISHGKSYLEYWNIAVNSILVLFVSTMLLDKIAWPIAAERTIPFDLPSKQLGFVSIKIESSCYSFSSLYCPIWGIFLPILEYR